MSDHKQRHKDYYKWKIEKARWGQIGRLKEGEELDLWPFGNFDKKPHIELAKTETFELKHWVVKKGEESKHSPKAQRTATEYILVIKGRTKGRVKEPKGDPQEITLREGDYIIIKPGIINNLVEEILTEEVMVITVRTPSEPRDSQKKRF